MTAHSGLVRPSNSALFWYYAMNTNKKLPLNSDFNGMPTFHLTEEDPRNPATMGFVGLTMMGPSSSTMCSCGRRGRDKCQDERGHGASR